MASFESEGFDEILADMKKMGELAGDVADEMLLEGAGILAQEWKLMARQYGFVDSGDMIESITHPKAPKQKGDIREIDVSPKGKDKTGTRNAEKAFILNYGSSRIDKTNWADQADANAEPLVLEAYQEIWDKFIEGGK